MSSNPEDLLPVLKSELEFLEKGGYRNGCWHPKLIFEDSPTCLNYKDLTRPRPCSECALMQFVPSAHRDAKIPCRHIPLNGQGATLDSLYRSASQEELEAVVAQWLRSKIQDLERKTAAIQGIESGTRKVNE